MTKAYGLDELNFESTIGGEGGENNLREVPVIDLSDFATRREEIKDQLWFAATEIGFFQLVNHGIATDEILTAFDASERFFALEKASKENYPLKEGLNAGWEFMAQVRPSTGTPDQKESYQVTLPHMDNLWPNQTMVPEFQRIILDFEHRAWSLGMSILSCFAEKLGFESDFFTKAHNRSSEEYQSTLRLLHYLPLADGATAEPGLWRAGAHTDFDCLTMVFQKEGQGGLQVCPGKEAKDGSQEWTSVIPKNGVITCNIGDMLMRWSDDKLLSTLHRVRMPKPEESKGPRYSMAFFCQANKMKKSEKVKGEKKYRPT